MRLREVPAYAVRFWWLCLLLAASCGAGAWFAYSEVRFPATQPTFFADTLLPALVPDQELQRLDIQGLVPAELFAPISTEEVMAAQASDPAKHAAFAIFNKLPDNDDAAGPFDPKQAAADPALAALMQALQQEASGPAALPASADGTPAEDWYKQDLRMEFAPVLGDSAMLMRVSNLPSSEAAFASATAIATEAWRSRSQAILARIDTLLRELEASPINEPSMPAVALQDIARNSGTAAAVAIAARMQAILRSEARGVSSHIEPANLELPANEFERVIYCEAVIAEIKRRFTVEGELLAAGLKLPEDLRDLMGVQLSRSQECRVLIDSAPDLAQRREKLQADQADWALIIAPGSPSDVEEFKPQMKEIREWITSEREAIRRTLEDLQAADNDERRGELAKSLQEARRAFSRQVDSAILEYSAKLEADAQGAREMRKRILENPEFASLAAHLDISTRGWDQLDNTELFTRAKNVYDSWVSYAASLATLTQAYNQAVNAIQMVEAARSERKNARAAQESLMRDLKALRAATAESGTSAGRVLQVARSTQKLTQDLFAMIGALIGLVISLFLMGVMAASRTRVMSEKDVEHHLGLDVIGQLTGENGRRVELLRDTSGSSLAAAYDSLSVVLDRTVSDFSIKSMLVAGAGAGQEPSAVAANLAVAFARMGRNVLLIDCDFQSSPLGALFEQRTTRRGLANEHSRAPRLKLGELVSGSGVQGLDLLLLRERITSPATLVRSEGYADLLMDAAEEYDMVICAGGSLFDAESAVLAGETDATLVHVSSGDVSFRQAQDLSKLLDGAEANVLGVVLAGGSASS